jgi:hypothetical protein
VMPATVPEVTTEVVVTAVLATAVPVPVPVIVITVVADFEDFCNPHMQIPPYFPLALTFPHIFLPAQRTHAHRNHLGCLGCRTPPRGSIHRQGVLSASVKDRKQVADGIDPDRPVISFHQRERTSTIFSRTRTSAASFSRHADFHDIRAVLKNAELSALHRGNRSSKSPRIRERHPKIVNTASPSLISHSVPTVGHTPDKFNDNLPQADNHKW